MTDRLFADCCYGSPHQHLPSEPCPQRFIHALEGVMNNLLARTALSDDLYKEILILTSACGREELLSPSAASADTRPQGGDAKQAPFTSGAVPSEAQADAQKDTPHD